VSAPARGVKQQPITGQLTSTTASHVQLLDTQCKCQSLTDTVIVKLSLTGQ